MNSFYFKQFLNNLFWKFKHSNSISLCALRKHKNWPISVLPSNFIQSQPLLISNRSHLQPIQKSFPKSKHSKLTIFRQYTKYRRIFLNRIKRIQQTRLITYHNIPTLDSTFIHNSLRWICTLDLINLTYTLNLLNAVLFKLSWPQELLRKASRRSYLWIIPQVKWGMKLLVLSLINAEGSTEMSVQWKVRVLQSIELERRSRFVNLDLQFWKSIE